VNPNDPTAAVAAIAVGHARRAAKARPDNVGMIVARKANVAALPDLMVARPGSKASADDLSARIGPASNVASPANAVRRLCPCRT
jgi:hypothetical protein